MGVSWQNLLSFYDQMKVLLSIRYDNIKVVTPEYKYDKDYKSSRGVITEAGKIVSKSEYSGNAWTTSLGLVYKVTPSASLYSSYLSGFELNRRGYKDEDEKLLPGYNQYQFEIGAKQSWFDNRLNLNMAYYHIDTKSYSDVDGNRKVYEISSGTQYKGIELEALIIPLEGLSLNVNYTYIDAKYAEGGSRKAGTRPQQTPEHQSGFDVSYTFPEGVLNGLNLSFGGTIYR